MNYPHSTFYTILSYPIKYNNYFPISRDFFTDLAYLTPKNLRCPITVGERPDFRRWTPLFHEIILGNCSVGMQRYHIKNYK